MALAESLSLLVERALADVDASANLAALDDVRVGFLGKKGLLTEQLKALGALPAAERPAAGQIINEAKAAIQAALEARRAALEEAALQAELSKGAHRCDAARPRPGAGGLHPGDSHAAAHRADFHPRPASKWPRVRRSRTTSIISKR